ncbi:hypothetical protein [Sphingomonas sp. HMP6]|uniref:hypothetical protein n=1 Tax=Sphingomonas sp. HMP6 TaxID=1517551 RepID=UPI001596B4E5|nr:hypothetical protein [Sphingomonas sp. HMP6]BCA60236.1 hypothetical protein HMP06_3005 [Sphingomonas sp. HMP6]
MTDSMMHAIHLYVAFNVQRELGETRFNPETGRYEPVISTVTLYPDIGFGAKQVEVTSEELAELDRLGAEEQRPYYYLSGGDPVRPGHSIE